MPATDDMQITQMALGDIKPYEGNPRVNAQAVEAVADSIKEFDYAQPILVNEDGVIVAGHTRFMAMRRLRWPSNKKVDVVIFQGTEEEANQYRIVDNKTHEYAKWDWDYLSAEVRDMDPYRASKFFSEAERKKLLEENTGSGAQVNQEQIERRRQSLESHHQKIAERANASLVDVHCDNCGEEFAVDRRNALQSWKLDREEQQSNEREAARAAEQEIKEENENGSDEQEASS